MGKREKDKRRKAETQKEQIGCMRVKERETHRPKGEFETEI